MGRIVIFVVGFALGGLMSASAQTLDAQKVWIKWTTYRYAVREDLVRAVLRKENGNIGFQAGLNHPDLMHGRTEWSDLPAYADPTMPDGALQHARLARRIVIHLQRWVFANDKRREAWLEAWSADYLAGGGADNWRYYAELSRIWGQERKAEDEEKRRGTFQPFTP